MEELDQPRALALTLVFSPGGGLRMRSDGTVIEGLRQGSSIQLVVSPSGYSHAERTRTKTISSLYCILKTGFLGERGNSGKALDWQGTGSLPS